MGCYLSKRNEHYTEMSFNLKKKMLKNGIIINTKNNKNIIDAKNIQEISWNNTNKKFKIKYKKEIFIEFTCAILPFEKIILNNDISSKHVEILFLDIDIRDSILTKFIK